MLTSVEIRNYRAFKHLRMDGLGRINLVAGKNNSGKTSLLEALFLLAGGGDASMAMNPHVVRSEVGSNLSPDIISRTIWHPLFRDLQPTNAIEIVGTDANRAVSRLAITMERSNLATAPNAAPAFVRPSGGASDPVLSFTYCSPSSKHDPVVNRICPSGQLVADADQDFRPTAAVILHSRYDNPNEDAWRLGFLRQRKQTDIVGSALRILEPNLGDVEVIVGAGGPAIWTDVGLNEMVPLSVMGDGITRLAMQLLAIGTVSGGIALIDEIESGYHHAVAERVWAAIEEAAARFNVQIVATTHSYECIMAAQQACDGDNLVLHRLDRHGDEHHCVRYSAELIESAMSFNMEVR